MTSEVRVLKVVRCLVDSLQKQPVGNAGTLAVRFRAGSIGKRGPRSEKSQRIGCIGNFRRRWTMIGA